MTTHRSWGLALAAGALIVTTAAADDIDWVSEVDGLYHHAPNWSPSTVPGPDDRAIFDLGGILEVFFFTDPVNDALFVLRGTVTFDLGNRTYDPGHMTVGGGTNFASLITRDGGMLTPQFTWLGFGGRPGFLTITDGTVFETEIVSIGNATSRGVMNVTGTGTGDVGSVRIYDQSVLGVNGGATFAATSLNVGANDAPGDGALEVVSGGQVSAQTVWIGLAAGSANEVTVSGPGSVLSFESTFEVGRAGGATATVSNGGALTGGNVYVGAFDGDEGHLIVDGADVDVDVLALRTANTGRLTLVDNGLVVPDSMLNYGVTEGHGAIRGPVANLGIMKPGGDGAVDTLRMTGASFEQFGDGTLEIEIDGPGPFDSDRLNVRGEAILGGTLDVRAIGGYEPTQGRRFNILLITAENGSISGKFDTVLPPDTWNVIYEDDTVLVTPIAGACPDLDGSGDIGFGDVLLVLGAWGACSGCDADVNGDEIVDFEDLLLILSLWGPCD